MGGLEPAGAPQGPRSSLLCSILPAHPCSLLPNTPASLMPSSQLSFPVWNEIFQGSTEQFVTPKGRMEAGFHDVYVCVLLSPSIFQRRDNEWNKGRAEELVPVSSFRRALGELDGAWERVDGRGARDPSKSKPSEEPTSPLPKAHPAAQKQPFPRLFPLVFQTDGLKPPMQHPRVTMMRRERLNPPILGAG